MARCAHIKADGTQCKRRTRGNSGLCWVHDPTTSKVAREIAGRRKKIEKVARNEPTESPPDVPRETSDPAELPAAVDTIDALDALVGAAMLRVHNNEMSVSRAEAIGRLAKIKKSFMTDRLGTKDRIQRLSDVELVAEALGFIEELQRTIVDPVDDNEEEAA